MGKKQVEDGWSAARIEEEEEVVMADGCETITRVPGRGSLDLWHQILDVRRCVAVASGVAVTPQHHRGHWKVRSER